MTDGAAPRVHRQRGLALVAKRSLDIGLVLVTSPVWVPLLLAVACAVRWRMGSPVFFRQRRPGYHGAPFTIRKFRTMTVAPGVGDRSDDDDERLTPLGRTLRSLSIDELPELFNVLAGEMSLVGPRPLRMEYLSRYSAEQARRHDVLPGITGLAQARGRNAMSWEERFGLDVWYVDHWSMLLDLKILAMSIRPVLRREGIAEPGHATKGDFTGTDARPSSSGLDGR